MDTITCLVTTYAVLRKQDIAAARERYVERVDRIRKFTKVHWISEHVAREADTSIVREVLLLDLRADKRDDPSFNEDEWELYSFSTVVDNAVDPFFGDPDLSIAWFGLRLCEESEIPRSFTSRTRIIVLSNTGKLDPDFEVIY